MKTIKSLIADLIIMLLISSLKLTAQRIAPKDLLNSDPKSTRKLIGEYKPKIV